MEAKKSSSKQVVAILLLVIGLAAGVFGVLGLVGGGGTDPYEARKSVVMVYSYLQLTDGQSAGAMGTGFAIGKPGEPVEYIVTNGHVVEYGYMGPKVYAEQDLRQACRYTSLQRKMIMLQRRWSIILLPMRRILRLSDCRQRRINEKPFPSGTQMMLLSATPLSRWGIRGGKPKPAIQHLRRG